MPVGLGSRSRGQIQVAQGRAAQAAGVFFDVLGQPGHAPEQLGQRQGRHHRRIGRALAAHHDLAALEVELVEAGRGVHPRRIQSSSQGIGKGLNAALFGVHE